MNDINAYPKNVGIIMDGNGRWALERGLCRTEGHTKGVENMLSTAFYAFSLGAENVVTYSLSIENLNREQNEVEHILGLVNAYFDKFISLCKKRKICVKYIGNLELLPEKILSSIRKTEEELSVFAGEKRTLYIAIAYGSRDEIISAVNKAVRDGKTVTKDTFLQSLSLPVELDLIIRTGGEQRLSNFFLYQASYAELYFSDKFFPDFSNEDLKIAFDWFANRNRRYGLVK